MRVKVGTFNLNNLFSRFNFSGAIDEMRSRSATGSMTLRYEFTDPDTFRIRTYLGKLVKGKDKDKTRKVAQRIIDMDLDVLAVQEVENIEILKSFNRDHLNNMYSVQVLVEGNDNRFIDVGVLSRLPVGAITSFQTAVHPENPGKRVFSRDLLEVEILNPAGSHKLFTLYNNHLKSHFGDDDDHGQGRIKNDARRRQQAETVAEIVAQRMRPNSRYIITGDMNDGLGAAPLQAMMNIEGNAMFNALTNPVETRPAKAESGGHNPLTTAWTHRFKPAGQPPEHELFDQIWLSPSLQSCFSAAYIDRRVNLLGDGSDHDPAWVELDI